MSENEQRERAPPVDQQELSEGCGLDEKGPALVRDGAQVGLNPNEIDNPQYKAPPQLLSTKKEERTMDTQEKTSKFASSGLFPKSADVKRPFKVSLEGFAGGGKSFTMALIALGIWLIEDKKKDVVLIDTERSSKFFIDIFKQHGLIEGKNFFVTPSRSLKDWEKIQKIAETEDAILLVDTVTHLHETMVKEYLESKKKVRLEVQDHMFVKPLWKKMFSTPLVEATNHILFTGRAAWDYAMETNEEGKREFFKSGIKMRGDNETAFEPDLVIYMERIEDVQGTKGIRVWRRATVMKDRANLMDGKQIKNPTFKDFEAVYKFLCGGQGKADAFTATPMNEIFKTQADHDYYQRRDRVNIMLEEIEGIWASFVPGQTVEVKKLRADIFWLVFETRSMTQLSNLHPDRLQEGKDAIDYIARKWCFSPPTSKEELENKDAWLKRIHEEWQFERTAGAREREADEIPEFVADGNGGEPGEQKPEPKSEPQPAGKAAKGKSEKKQTDLAV